MARRGRPPAFVLCRIFIVKMFGMLLFSFLSLGCFSQFWFLSWSRSKFFFLFQLRPLVQGSSPDSNCFACIRVPVVEVLNADPYADLSLTFRAYLDTPPPLDPPIGRLEFFGFC